MAGKDASNMSVTSQNEMNRAATKTKQRFCKPSPVPETTSADNDSEAVHNDRLTSEAATQSAGA